MPRLPVSFPARLGGRVPRAATLVDLSLSGCLLRCDKALGPGSIHDLELGLPEAPLRAKARVSCSSREGAAEGEAERFLVGLEFLQLAAGDAVRLRVFLDAEARRCAAAR